MSIGICGVGFVGHAMYTSFITKGIDVIPYDKYKNIGQFEDLLLTKILFLCLPTPFNTSLNNYEIDAIEDTLSLLKEYHGLIVIKSTVIPGTIKYLSAKYEKNIVHNPEFLTARTAFVDFHNQKHIVLGTYSIDDVFLNLFNFYKLNYPDANISVCTPEESESMKIFVNSFYAVKVQFFNELYLLCKSMNVDYDNVKKLMLSNGWINEMHTTVPGPDGELSYGGMCLPKDTNALLELMRKQNSPHQILQSTILERNEMRKDNINII